jgi:two-component system LytT family response regulator/two-component system response regulator AlgR
VTLTAVIVDDEPVAVRRLQSLLRAIPGVEVLGTAQDAAAAIELLTVGRPDLLFADIEMPGMSGLDLVRALDPATAPVVVFVTAFAQYALDAISLDGAHYLLKPFEPDRLEEAVERARRRITERTAAEREAELRAVVAALRGRLENTAEQSSIWISTNDGERRLALNTLVWLEAERDYVRLHTKSGGHLVRGTLNGFEQQLPIERFVRVHRSAIVRIDAVRAIRRRGDRTCDAMMETGDAVPVARGYRRCALPRLKGASESIEQSGLDTQT